MSSQRWWRRAALSFAAFLFVVAWAPVASADRTVTANEPIQWFDDVRNRFQDLVLPSGGPDGDGGSGCDSGSSSDGSGNTSSNTSSNSSSSSDSGESSNSSSNCSSNSSE